MGPDRAGARTPTFPDRPLTPLSGRRVDTLAALVAALWAGGAALAGQDGLWLGVGSVALVLGAAVLVLDPLGLRARLRPSAGRVLVGLLAGVAMCGVTYGLYPLLARAAPALAEAAASLYRSARFLSPLAAAVALGPIIVGEELVWRGLVQGALARRVSEPASVLLGTAAYVLAHAPIRSPLLLAAAFGCGLTWGALRAVTGSLVPAIVAHLVWDAAVLLIRPLAL